MTPKTLIIIPCFNEELRLDTCAFINFLKNYKHISFLFVNDGSTDKTEILLKNLAEKQKDNIQILNLSRNSGKAEAVRQGFLKGFSLCPDFIGYLDADLAAPLECIPDLEHVIYNRNKDIVIGSRIALLGWKIKRNNFRHYAGRVFATAVSMALGLRVYDTQCGAKLFRVTERLKVIFSTPFVTKWIFDVEILARFQFTETTSSQNLNSICFESPLEQWIDKKGSKLNLMDFIHSAIDLIKLMNIIRRKSLPRL
ncbi:MAG: glycosyltransferase [Candidatus Omnitrophica bacterium]|nr:glycosyltransferase [Candidatus Omnitrophota bacterium]